jgi:hypothetical protein
MPISLALCPSKALTHCCQPPRFETVSYNCPKRLKTLKGVTPSEFICNCWTSQPERFILNPLQQMPGLNS